MVGIFRFMDTAWNEYVEDKQRKIQKILKW